MITFYLKRICILTVCSLFLAACVPNSIGVQGSHARNTGGGVDALLPDQRYIVEEPLGVQYSRSQAGKFNARIIFLADQLERNADRKSLGNTFIVTSFSNLNKLSETSGFGRLVAENLIHELQVRKWQVFDIRMTKDIIVNEAGEFSLSRDIKKIRDMYKVGGVVTGTYSVVDSDIIVNARSMDINTGIVLSSAQARMRVDWFTDALLFNGDRFRDMKIVGDHPGAHGK
ncbi:MAG TPA: hypothetical protein HPP76_01660 [Desulfuromonadales bacterium]|nr:hypothetical protein [Desulfuromonadales bacterium]